MQYQATTEAVTAAFIIAQTKEIKRLRERLHTVTVSLEENPVLGYVDMDRESVQAVALNGMAWDRPSAQRALRRLDALKPLDGTEGK